MRSFGREGAARGFLIALAVVLGTSAGTMLSGARVWAQEPDSTATSEGGSLLGQIGKQTMDGTEMSDSLRVSMEERTDERFDFFGGFEPVATAEVESDVNKVAGRGRLRGTLTWLDGGISNLSYGGSDTEYRQQDRDQLTTDLGAGFQRRFGEQMNFVIDFRRNTNKDTNRLSNGETVVVDYGQSSARIGLDGHHEAPLDLRHTWKVHGDLEDVNQTNRGTNNDRSLATAGVSSRWRHERETWWLTGRLGLDGSAGTRQLRGREADASARRDTVGTAAEIDLGPRLSLRIDGELTRSEENRLDFARNASGVIDTLGANEGEKVGEETETVEGNSLVLNLDARPFSRIGLGGSLNQSFSETEYVFSRQGVVQNGREQAGVYAGFRYAPAGSLRVDYDFSDAWNDRRTTDSNTFRGRESRQSNEVGLEVDQKVMRETDLEVSLKQTLDRNVFEEETNTNDRDRLVERVDGKLTSSAIPKVNLNAGATLSVTREVNIAAERVGNNKNDRLYEVRAGYTYRPFNGIRWTQSYRLQILFIDFHNSNDRDQFNKQGQLRNELDVDLPNGSVFEVDYSIDFRKTGKRDTELPFRRAYFTDQRRFDHQVKARLTVPWRWLELSVDSERSFLREERGVNDIEEDRGRVSFKLTGQQKFWKNKIDLVMNVQRVLQFGPRVREEQEDYFVANSSLTVRF